MATVDAAAAEAARSAVTAAETALADLSAGLDAAAIEAATAAVATAQVAADTAAAGTDQAAKDAATLALTEAQAALAAVNTVDPAAQEAATTALADAQAAFATATEGADMAAVEAARATVTEAQATLDAAKGVKAAFEGALNNALKAVGYPLAGVDNPTIAKAAHVLDIFTGQKLLIIAILTYLIILVTMVYGPIAAMLVELFPTRIRYSGLSLPYHIGNGWFGGLLPATAFAISAQTGNIYSGLWYAIVVALMTVVIGTLFVPGGTHRKSIFADDAKR